MNTIFQRKKPLKHELMLTMLMLKIVNATKVAYHVTKDTYNKKSISINAKLGHHLTVIRPEALYALSLIHI